MILELFAGIGGVAATGAHVVAAIDHDEAAHLVYTRTFDHPAHRLNLASVRSDFLRRFEADTWWMSPPCQPFTVRGKARDVDDPRCAALLHLLGCLAACLPRAVVLENVPGFAGSRAHARVLTALRQHGYATAERLLCPTELGTPNRRRRFYLVARRDEAPGWPPLVATRWPLAAALDPVEHVDPSLYLTEAMKARFGSRLAVVHHDDPAGVAHCFTGAYGRSPVHAGSYLHDGRGIRHFSPGEILRLLGFEPPVEWPDEVRRAKRWKLVGNSLSVPAARWVLQATRREQPSGSSDGARAGATR